MGLGKTNIGYFSIVGEFAKVKEFCSMFGRELRARWRSDGGSVGFGSELGW